MKSNKIPENMMASQGHEQANTPVEMPLWGPGRPLAVTLTYGFLVAVVPGFLPSAPLPPSLDKKDARKSKSKPASCSVSHSGSFFFLCLW